MRESQALEKPVTSRVKSLEVDDEIRFWGENPETGKCSQFVEQDTLTQSLSH